MTFFKDRLDAGRKLASALSSLKSESPVVVALLRGGVPVAFEVARALGSPLEILHVRKIGAPHNPELGIGAVTENGVSWLNRDLISSLGVTPSELEESLVHEQSEVLRRSELYNSQISGPKAPIEDQVIILVDDGLATGGTARAAARLMYRRGARQVIFATPVCAPDSFEELASEVDQLICLRKPEDFRSVGSWYEDFSQVSDGEVLALLTQTRDGQVSISSNGITLSGKLTLPRDPLGVVIFAHGSGSSRKSPRNLWVAQALNDSGLGTLLFDLLTPEEALDRKKVFDIPLLAERVDLAFNWLRGAPQAQTLPIGYFGASTGAAAALFSAARKGNEIVAVVSRGGRPDLALEDLTKVTAPTLLLVGSEDEAVLSLNRKALEKLPGGQLIIIPGATHLFEEVGALEAVARQAIKWFSRHFSTAHQKAA